MTTVCADGVARRFCLIAFGGRAGLRPGRADTAFFVPALVERTKAVMRYCNHCGSLYVTLGRTVNARDVDGCGDPG